MLILGLVVQIAVLFLAFQLIAIPVGAFTQFGLMKAERWAALAAIGIAVVLTAGLELLRPEAELNSTVTEQQLLGTWSSNDRELELFETRYTLQSKSTSYENTWKLTDGNVYLLKDDAPSELLRVIKYGDDYRLLIDSLHKDPDSYIYKHAFTR